MLKIIIIVMLSFVSHTEPLTTAQKYCGMTNVCPNRSSVACKFATNPSMKCNGSLLKLDRAKIVHYHNSRRNLIALGRIPRYDPARRMATMQWSSELERMAKYNVMTCTFGHDKCRNTNIFPKSGQNLYSTSSSGPITVSINTIILDGVKAWFAENKNCNMNLIRNFRFTSQPNGHFTQMIKYNSNRIGCAANQITENGRTRILIACNYANNNILNRPIYGPGRSGSRCITGRNSNYRGLCSINEKF